MACYDPWLSAALGRAAWRVSGELPENLITDHTSPIFIDAKPAVHDVEAHDYFFRCGFRLVCTSVLFKCNEFKSVSESGSRLDYQIRFADSFDRSVVGDLAAASFKYDRFHTDTSISDDIADLIKRQWAENFFLGQRGDWMVVAQERGQIVGFLQLINQGGEALMIDLIAVKASARGRGYARRMISFAAKNCMEGAPILVGTQLANVASIALYEEVGFRMMAANHVFHLNRDSHHDH